MLEQGALNWMAGSVERGGRMVDGGIHNITTEQ